MDLEQVNAESTGQMPAGLVSMGYRLLEAERENRRLRRLVAELLIKNQQLRERIAVNGDA
jgi:hypothetical protein